MSKLIDLIICCLISFYVAKESGHHSYGWACLYLLRSVDQAVYALEARKKV